jgi:LacI family transcriptional regulator
MSAKSASGRRQVVVAIHMEGFAQRELILGFCRAAHEHGEWNLHFLPRLSQDARLAAAGLGWRPDGLVAYSESRAVAKALRSTASACVDFGDGWVPGLMPGYDQIEVGRMAATHLLACGYPRLALVSIAGVAGRCDGFRAGASPLAQDLAEYAVDYKMLDDPAYAAQMRRWLSGLQPPCGIFAHNDRLAQVVAAQVRHLGLSIPDEIGLIGADADPVLSRLTHQSLSSVRLPFQEAGYRGGAILAHLMAGHSPVRFERALPPTEVIAGSSTALRHHADPIVAQVGDWLQVHLHETSGIAAIAAALGIPRRTLERRYAASTGHSLLTEIQRQRLVRARIHLREGLNVGETAARLGITPNRFVTWFRIAQGVTPGVYQTLWLSQHRGQTDPAEL